MVPSDAELLTEFEFDTPGAWGIRPEAGIPAGGWIPTKGRIPAEGRNPAGDQFPARYFSNIFPNFFSEIAKCKSDSLPR